MKIGHIELFCHDCRKTKEFYVDVLGFEETEVQGGKFVWLRSEEIDLLLRPGRPGQGGRAFADCASAMVVYCDDVATLQHRMDSSGIATSEPDASPGGLTFRDPDGRWLQAVEQ